MMHVITKIEAQKKDKQRVNLYIDNEFRCGLSAESVYRYGLKVGNTLPPELLDEILSTYEAEQAFSKGCRFIEKSMKTRKQVIDYLFRKGYDEKAVIYATEKMTEYGYIDDTAYAALYAEQSSNAKGARRIAADLMQKGVDKELAVNVAGKIQNKDAAKEIAQKYLKNKEITRETLAKLQRHLLSKGFEYEEIREVIVALIDEISIE